MPLFGASRSGRSQSVGATEQRSGNGILRNHNRAVSAPPHHHGRHRYRFKGIMKFVTADESLHSTYGGGSGDEETKDQQRRPSRSVQFKDILVREYGRTVGDNPSCSSGPPVTISWSYDPETKIISVDQYEELRPARRTHFEMILPRDVRQAMLRKEWDVTQQQIAAAVRANIKAKNQRRATINNLGKATKAEEMFESVGRKLKRGLFFQKSVTKQVEELNTQLEIVNTARQTRVMQELMREDDVDEQDLKDYGGGGDGKDDVDEYDQKGDDEREEDATGVATEDECSDEQHPNKTPTTDPTLNGAPVESYNGPKHIQIEEDSSDDDGSNGDGAVESEMNDNVVDLQSKNIVDVADSKKQAPEDSPVTSVSTAETTVTAAVAGASGGSGGGGGASSPTVGKAAVPEAAVAVSGEPNAGGAAAAAGAADEEDGDLFEF